jgi:hypothetical protein
MGQLSSAFRISVGIRTLLGRIWILSLTNDPVDPISASLVYVNNINITASSHLIFLSKFERLSKLYVVLN